MAVRQSRLWVRVWIGMVCGVWVLTLTSWAVNPSAVAKLDKVVLQLRWRHQFQFAGYYAAKALGYYREAGLDVEIRQAQPGQDVIEEILVDRAQYGVTGPAMLVRYLQGEPIVVLGAIFQHSPSVLLARTDSGISKPQDLVGKRVMMERDWGAAEVLSMLRRENVAQEQVNLVETTYDIQALISGQVDVYNGYSTNEPFFLRQQGVGYVEIHPYSFGIDSYGDSLFTTQGEVAAHPARVAAFRKASFRGWQYAMTHPDEVIQILRAQYGCKKSEAHLHFEAEAMRGLIFPELIEIGHMNRSRWARVAQMYVSLGMAPERELDAFLYTPPTPGENYVWLWKAAVALLLVASVVGVCALGLLFFNLRLRRAVLARTREYREVNAALKKEVKENQRVQVALQENRRRYQSLFQDSPVALCEEDYSAVYDRLMQWREEYGKGLENFLRTHPKSAIGCIKLVRIVDANTKTYELFQVNSLVELNEKYTRFFVGETRKAALAGMFAMLQGGTRFQAETALKTIYGEKRTIVVEWRKAPGSSERYERLLVSYVDITHLKQIERELEHRIETAQAISHVSSHFVNADASLILQEITYALQVAGELTGADRARLFLFSDDERTITSVSEWCAPGIPSLQQVYQKLDVNGRVRQWFMLRMRNNLNVSILDVQNQVEISEEMRRHLLDNGICSLMASPMFFRGRLMGYLGFEATRKIRHWDAGDFLLLRVLAELFANALERAQVERALRISEERLEMALKNAQLGMFDYHVPSQEATVSAMWLNMLDLPAKTKNERVDISYWLGRVHAEDKEGLSALLEDMKTGRCDSMKYEYRLRTQSGKWKWVFCQGRVCERDELGQAVRIVGIHQDLTERKAAEAERLSLERNLQHAQKLESLGVLAGGIAHDFNNLLVGIIGNIDLGLSKIAADHEVVEYFGRAEKAAWRATELVTQILAYSGKGRVVVEQVHVNEVVEEIRRLLEASVSKKIDLRFHLAKSLPCIEGDRSQIHQVIMNLIINAAEAIGEDAGKITVTTARTYISGEMLDKEGFFGNSALTSGDYVQLTVQDSGCGMNAEMLARIFEPFYTTKFTGRGLGMAAVQGIVHAHNGAGRVRSTVGEGTVFEVYFPAISVQSETTPDPVTAEEPQIYSPQECPTILLVDDEIVVREVASEILQTVGFKVVLACDGKEAISVFRAMQQKAEDAPEIDCVVLDLTMPHMDGLETLQVLQSIAQEVPIIIASGYSEEEIAKRIQNKNVAGVIQKPYSARILREKIGEALRNSQDLKLAP